MMWLILYCSGYCDIDAARRSGWRADVALAVPYPNAWSEHSSDRFTTQAECLSALKRQFPAGKKGPDKFGQIDETTHRRFYVRKFSVIPYVQVGGADYACFQEAPRLS